MFLTQDSLGLLESLAANAESISIDCQQMSKICFQITHNSTVIFDATIQQSNDGVNWANTEATADITAAGTVVLERIDCCARYHRLSLVRTSGTLSELNVVFNGKF